MTEFEVASCAIVTYRRFDNPRSLLPVAANTNTNTNTNTNRSDTDVAVDDRSLDIDTTKFTFNTFIELAKQYSIGFIVVHYFLWCFAMFFVLYLIYHFLSIYASIAVVLAYMPSFTSGSHLSNGAPWHWLRTHALWHPVQRYLKMAVVRTTKLDNKKQYVFGFYPHGILILSRVATYGGIFEKLFPGIECRVLGASPMFYVPGARELCLWMGAIDASRSVAVKLLRRIFPLSSRNRSGKMSLMVYPGGSKEIFNTDKYSPNTKLVTRTGFIRLALENGCDLVPVYVFNEHHAYERVTLPRALRSFMLNVLKIPLLIFYGRAFTWIPLNDRPITVVYGRPIPAPTPTPSSSASSASTSVSDALVDEYHTKFHDAIRALFEEHKVKFGYQPTDQLIMEAGAGENKKQK